ncbi:MAG: adenylate kinase [Candidatus Ratteibacteria bacterium]|nr:adenylate kinase [Candidatus Ratteibacteria bacterium]
MKKVLILLGPPGAGKGTVGNALADEWELPLISSGDILRENLKKKTEIGNKAKQYIESGELVPDEIVIEMIEQELKKTIYINGFILDGFPRTVNQAKMLDRIVDNSTDLKVIYLKADDDFLVNRLSNRRICEKCGKIYHLINIPPIKEGICDICGGKLMQRVDDREDVVRRRLTVYKEQTAPLIEYYRNQGILSIINGEGNLRDTLSEIKKFTKW